jgi:hypothetical protein
VNIETGVSPTGDQYISFIANYNEKFTIVAQKDSLRCAIREEDNISLHAPFTHFSREQVAALLPYLQSFVETGSFERQE